MQIPYKNAYNQNPELLKEDLSSIDDAVQSGGRLLKAGAYKLGDIIKRNPKEAALVGTGLIGGYALSNSNPLLLAGSGLAGGYLLTKVASKRFGGKFSQGLLTADFASYPYLPKGYAPYKQRENTGTGGNNPGFIPDRTEQQAANPNSTKKPKLAQKDVDRATAKQEQRVRSLKLDSGDNQNKFDEGIKVLRNKNKKGFKTELNRNLKVIEAWNKSTIDPGAKRPELQDYILARTYIDNNLKEATEYANAYRNIGDLTGSGSATARANTLDNVIDSVQRERSKSKQRTNSGTGSNAPPGATPLSPPSTPNTNTNSQPNNIPSSSSTNPPPQNQSSNQSSQTKPSQQNTNTTGTNTVNTSGVNRNYNVNHNITEDRTKPKAWWRGFGENVGNLLGGAGQKIGETIDNGVRTGGEMFNTGVRSGSDIAIAGIEGITNAANTKNTNAANVQIAGTPRIARNINEDLNPINTQIGGLLKPRNLAIGGGALLATGAGLLGGKMYLDYRAEQDKLKRDVEMEKIYNGK